MPKITLPDEPLPGFGNAETGPPPSGDPTMSPSHILSFIERHGIAWKDGGTVTIGGSRYRRKALAQHGDIAVLAPDRNTAVLVLAKALDLEGWAFICWD